MSRKSIPEKLLSRKILPYNKRKRLKTFKESEQKTQAYLALKALLHLEWATIKIIRAAKRDNRKYINLFTRMYNQGYMMSDMPVVPEDAGFNSEMEEVVLGEVKADKYVFRKKGTYLYHLQDSHWVVGQEAWTMPIVMEFKNMSEFVICMRALGVEIDVKEVMAT